MVERTKGSGPDRNGLRTEPVTGFFDTSRSTSGDQFHLSSQPNSDQPPDLISNRDTDLALSESKSLMALLGESTSFFDTSRSTSGDQFHLPSQPNSDQPSDLISNRDTDLASREPKSLMALLGESTSVFDTSRSASGVQFRLPSQPNSDQPSDLISNRDTDLALSESKSLMVQFAESGASDNIDKRWESDRRRLEKWSIGAKMTVFAMAAIAIMIAIAIPLVFFEDDLPLARETRQQIVVPKATATETALAVARQSSEPPPASAERNWPQDPANRLNSGLAPDDTAADTKSVGQDQAHETRQQIVVPKETATETALAVARQSSELPLASAERNWPQDPANRLNSGLTPDDTAANTASTKSVGQDQVPSTQALAATQRPARLIDKEELANLLKRGHYFLSIGDIAPARLLLERAADAHDASAAFDLAGTYDPAVLSRSHLSGIAPDLAMARMWYQKALELGHSEAQQRLAQLQK